MSKLPDPTLFKEHKLKLADIYRTPKISKGLSELQLQAELDRFETISLKKHEKELSKIAPLWLYYAADKNDINLFRHMSRFDKDLNSFVTGCYENSDLDFKLISYKHRRKIIRGEMKKWVTRFNTSPNSTPLIRIYSDEQPIYVIEGHHDALTAILLGLDFVMLPTAGYRNTEYFMKDMLGRDVIFLVEDKPAYDAMKNIAQHITPISKSVILKTFGDGSSKTDLSDYCFECRSIEEVLYGIRN